MDKNGKLKNMMYSLLDYDIRQYERYKDTYNLTFLKNRLDRNTAAFCLQL